MKTELEALRDRLRADAERAYKENTANLEWHRGVMYAAAKLDALLASHASEDEKDQRLAELEGQRDSLATLTVTLEAEIARLREALMTHARMTRRQR